MLLLACASASLIGCETLRLPGTAASPNETAASRPAAPSAPDRISGPVKETGAQATGPVVSLAREAPPPRSVHGVRYAPGGDITLDFVDTDVREVARSVLSDLLKLNYTIDPAVTGAVTLRVLTPVAKSDLLPLFEGAIQAYNLGLIYENGVYRLTQADKTLAVGRGALSDVGGGATEIIPLRYASARQLAKLLSSNLTEGSRIAADDGKNQLIVTGSTPVRRSLIDLIRIFDVDYLSGQSYALLPVSDGAATKISLALKRFFDAGDDGVLAGVVRVVPVDQMNAVLVIAPQQAYLERAERFVADLERTRTQTDRTMHVYYLQNGTASDVAKILNRAFGPHASSIDATDEVAEGAPATVELSVSGSSGAQGAQSKPLSANVQAAGTPGGEPTAQGQDGTGQSDKTLSNGAETPKGLRIVANPRTNSLLIYASKAEYDEVEATLRRIDIVPRQVLIEATIAEVTLNDSLKYGTQFFFKQKELGSFSLKDLNVGVLAGTDFILGNLSGQNAIEALKGVTEVKVLSAPQLMVLDGEKAQLLVGNSVPIQTQSSQSTLVSGAPIVNSIDYRETGVILSITPRIATSGLVTFNIEQEVSAVVNTTSSTINSPSFSDRRVRSRVAVNDGETVGLAGLITDNTNDQKAGIPYLQDIPYLGALFSNTKTIRDRTELIVLITPHILRDQSDMRALADELRRSLPAATGLVRNAPRPGRGPADQAPTLPR
jgi:general secretion pathway protein D